MWRFCESHHHTPRDELSVGRTLRVRPLGPGDAKSLQRALWEQHRIQTPIIAWGGERWIRVSCHLYTTKAEIDRLIDAVRVLT